MNRIKGILYAAVSSSTFGLAPFFSITLLLAGFSAFEVLSYRWGVASIVLIVFGWLSGCNFRLAKKDLLVVFLLSLLRATTSFSLLIAYQNIATGVASTIHFMYPLAVSLAMMFFFHEKKSLLVMLAVLMSLFGAALLSSGELEAKSGYNRRIGGGLYFCLFLRRIHHWGSNNTSRSNQFHCTDLLCYGVGNYFLPHRRLLYFRTSTCVGWIYLADYSWAGITGYGYFQYNFSTSY